MKPSYYEELEIRCAEQQAIQILALQSLIEELRKKIEELKHKFNKNSKNSFRSPSLDWKANTENTHTSIQKSRKGYARILYPPEKIAAYVECTEQKCPFCKSICLEQYGTKGLQQVEPIVTDCYSAYRGLAKNYQYCLAHLI